VAKFKEKVLYVNFSKSVYTDKSNLYCQQIHSLLYKKKLCDFLCVSYLLNAGLKLKEDIEGLKIYSRDTSTFLFLVYTIVFVQRKKIDFVIIHGVNYFLFAFLIKKLTTAKVILQHHAEKTYLRKKALLMPLTDKSTDGYFFNGINLAESFLKKKYISKHKIFEIIEGSNDFRLIERKLINIHKNIVFVGRLNDNKNVIALLKAISLIKTINRNFKVDIHYTTNELEAELRIFCKENELDGIVFFRGKVSNVEMERILNQADIFVSTSFYEGSGYALIEALACGVYPVVSNIPSFNFLLDGLDEKKQFDPTDEKQLAMQLADALNLNFTEEIRQKIRNHFEVKASANAIAMQIKNALMQL
jgi:glycosyltransferase involved in cell wall biosynthesis